MRGSLYATPSIPYAQPYIVVIISFIEDSCTLQKMHNLHMQRLHTERQIKISLKGNDGVIKRFIYKFFYVAK